jgi:hypothetical protein
MDGEGNKASLRPQSRQFKKFRRPGPHDGREHHYDNLKTFAGRSCAVSRRARAGVFAARRVERGGRDGQSRRREGRVCN